MVERDMRPVGMTCSRCGLRRDVTPSIETEYGDYGSIESSYLVYAVDPPCAGWVTHDDWWSHEMKGAHGTFVVGPAEHEATEAACEACSVCDGEGAMCPFDGRDDYGPFGDTENIRAVLADRKRYGRAPVPVESAPPVADLTVAERSRPGDPGDPIPIPSPRAVNANGEGEN